MSQSILEKIEKAKGILFKGAQGQTLSFTNEMLSTHNLSPLPKDYMDLLTIADGFTYNGIDFYGTQAHERLQQLYTFPSLIDINAPFKDNKKMWGKVILGTNGEELLVYEDKSQEFTILDRATFHPLSRYGKWEAALSAFLEFLIP